MKDLLMVMAHPDDELLWGWSVLRRTKRLLVCSTDLHNERRAWCSHRKHVLAAVCDEIGIELLTIDNNSSFYLANSRDGSLRRIADEIASTVIRASGGCAGIFTHNPHGEYGHMDHRLVFQAVIQAATLPILITDIVQSSNWMSAITLSDTSRRLYYHSPVGEEKMDTSWIENLIEKYRDEKVFTWNDGYPHRCTLHRL